MGGGLFTLGLKLILDNVDRIQMRRRGQRPPTRYDPDTDAPLRDGDEAEQIFYSAWLMLFGLMLMLAAADGIVAQNDSS